jgi:transposase-like protein
MKIKIELYYPCCHGAKIRKNGRKYSGKRNYMCKDCGCRFAGDHSSAVKLTVRGHGVRGMED